MNPQRLHNYSPNPMCLKVQSDCGKYSSERQPVVARFCSARSSPPTSARWRREVPFFRLFPGVTVLLLPLHLYPPSMSGFLSIQLGRSHAVGSETPGCPQSARCRRAAQSRSPIYVPTRPGEHIASDSYRASPAISTRNPSTVISLCALCGLCARDVLHGLLYCTSANVRQSGLGRLVPVPDDPRLGAHLFGTRPD